MKRIGAQQLAAALAAAAPALAAAFCWDEAASRYGIERSLLEAIADVESGRRAQAMNLDHVARTGTYDIGLMQINSAHLPRLRSYGLSEADLMDPCINLQVGAWILAESFARHGATWNAVGAYNAACAGGAGPKCDALRSRYAWRVYRRLPRGARPSPIAASIGAGHDGGSGPPAYVSYVIGARVSP